MARHPMARLDTPVACLFVFLAASSIFLFGQLLRADFDPSAFIVAGDAYSDPRATLPGVAVLKDSRGYDGQFYYRLALDPFTSRRTDDGITLDNPAYRHQRILYPLIVHIVAFGDAQRVPAAMLVTNVAFFGLLAWLAGSLAQTLGRHALWGLLIVAYPGFLITLSRDLVEIVEVTFLCASVLLLRRDKPLWSTAAMTLAVWTRETSVVVAVAAGLVLVFDRWRGRPVQRFEWTWFAVPILGFCALQGALYLNWGRVPIAAGSAIVLGSRPLDGFMTSLTVSGAISQTAWVGQIVALAFIALCATLILFNLASTNARRAEVLACILYAVLMVSVGGSVWAEDIAFMRAFAQFYLFGAIVVLAGRVHAPAILLALLVAVTWIFECYRLGAATGIVHGLGRHFGGG